ncbi:hypothetical protein F8388_011007 [Cannabis sativa]|uniref:Uncharacterized protein n=1 Tax=Cannabis sativa TaxID=3483 RepID=A0A7J6FT31_CANSA|nr:hypothetical protein F8388_011007 [Cannabis sativa]
MFQVNNAGVLIRKKSIEFNDEDISTLLGTNFVSGFHISQLSHPLFKASGNGSIVFISSIAGAMAISDCAIYGATKGTQHSKPKEFFPRSFLTSQSSSPKLHSRQSMFFSKERVNGFLVHSRPMRHNFPISSAPSSLISHPSSSVTILHLSHAFIAPLLNRLFQREHRGVSNRHVQREKNPPLVFA